MAMTDTWDSPNLDEPIGADLPAIQRKFQALVKGDPSLVQNPPVGAKRLVEISSGNWQVQQYNGSTWSNIGKLKMDVDTVDGYDAAITPKANTIAVRNASGKLEGDITGHASTSGAAQTLSETLPVSTGGTGATTSAQARYNLGVPPTSHASSGTAYGLGSNLNYGHVRGDGETTNIVTGEVVVKDVAIGGNVNDLASKRGQIGKDYLLPDGGDLNDLRTPGNYGVRGTTWENVPEKAYARIQVLNGPIQSSGFAGGLAQLWCTIGQQYIHWFYRSFVQSTQTWSDWVKFVDETDLATSSTPGIVKPGTGMTVGTNGALNVDTASTSKAGIVQLNNTVTSTSTTQAPTANAVKTAYDKAVAAEAAIANALPVGTLLPSFASSMSGYLLGNGAEVSRITYANLFAILGTTFGKGDGSTTFNLPDFRDKTFWGANGNLKEVIAAGLPNITSTFNYTTAFRTTNTQGAVRIVTASYGAGISSGDSAYRCDVDFNASRSNKIYGGSTTVQPPAIAVNIFIKY
ncbi:tail fiber protein [Desulfovibrio piger]|uniref:tail fiber protein n=1 Tax=Desulfovibrio piger TaxID=901 RepID=UPI0026F353ED|nr:tail fiber protein [Desulfovibrio piger]